MDETGTGEYERTRTGRSPAVRVALVALGSGLLLEGITIACGLIYGGSGQEFAEEYAWPTWLRFHHGWYGIGGMLLALAFRGRPRLFAWIFGVAAGILLSDVLHHLVFAPLLYGDMRWHWP